MIKLEIDKKQLSELVLKLQAGDGKAFEQIYNLTNKSAYFTALKITKNEDDAQDVLQEAYIKLLEKVNELDKPESFMSWFNMIVANKAKDFMRKNNPNLFTDNVISGGKDGEEEFSVFDTIEEDNEEFIPGAGIEQAELQRQVMGLIESLSDEKRTAILLYYYNEMTTKQIAESLGVNENTVKSRLVQAKKDLAKGVKELEKKNGKLLGIAPIPVIIWALKGASAITGASFVSSGAAAATLTAVSAGSAVAATTATATGTGVAATGVATKVIAGIVAASIIGGGAIAGTRAIQSRNTGKETTTVVTTIEEKVTTDRYKDVTIPDDKLVDTIISKEELRYGVVADRADFAVKTENGVQGVDTKPAINKSSFSATYDEILPYAKENQQKYSSQAASVVNGVNDIRTKARRGALNANVVLAEQANVRAEEIAWSGRNNSIRPNGESYTTVYDRNGLTDGTRLEIRVTGYSSPDSVINVLRTNQTLLTTDADEIGVGVSQDPATEELVYVIHLYSSKGSGIGSGISIFDLLDDRRNDNIDAIQQRLQEKRDELAEIDEQGSDGSLISEILNYDFHDDAIVLGLKQISDKLLEESQKTKDKLDNILQ